MSQSTKKHIRYGRQFRKHTGHVSKSASHTLDSCRRNRSYSRCGNVSNTARPKVNAILALASKADTDITGYTVDKQMKRSDLKSKVLKLSGGIVAHTALTDDFKTNEKCDATPSQIDYMRDNDFDTAIDVKQDAVKNRDIKTQDRIIKGNAVFKEITRLCNSGKSLFVNTDEAKYNDYVIHNTPSGTDETPLVTP